MKIDNPDLGPVVLLAGLCLLLLLIYLPSFGNPPHGDYWEAFYSFQQYRAASAFQRLILVINHDPWQDGTFRPFSYLLLYLIHALFGSQFVWYGVVNFLLYCLNVFLLYRLAVCLKLQRLASAVFLGIYIFLFSHSGIITLTFHQFVMAGFAALLGGFITYFRWLEQGKKYLLPLTGLLFLFGMFCYEVFIFWPLSIIFLHCLFQGWSVKRPEGLKTTGCGYDWGLLAAVYLIYLGVFLLTRTAPVTTGSLPEITAVQVGLSLCAAFFNLTYNGIIINLFPFLSLPCRFQDWVEMGGLINDVPEHILPAVIIGAGIITLLLIAFGCWRLYCRRKREKLLKLSFLLFLYVGSFFLLFLARIPLGDFHHILIQFRYQYIPNALLILMVATLPGPRLTECRRRIVIVGCAIFLVLVANIIVSHQTVTSVNRHLAPLKRVMNRLKDGIASGEINPQDQIYIQRGITDYLPQLSWQSGIGRRMQGSYEWVFYPHYGDHFTRDRGEAAWILDSPLGIYRRKENAGE